MPTYDIVNHSVPGNEIDGKAAESLLDLSKQKTLKSNKKSISSHL